MCLRILYRVLVAMSGEVYNLLASKGCSACVFIEFILQTSSVYVQRMTCFCGWKEVYAGVSVAEWMWFHLLSIDLCWFKCGQSWAYIDGVVRGKFLLSVGVNSAATISRVPDLTLDRIVHMFESSGW